LSQSFPGTEIYHVHADYAFASGNLLLNGKILLYLCSFAVILFCMALSLYFSFGKSATTLFLLMILGLGLASRMIMGFSPTLYASGIRTFVPLQFAMVFCSMFIFDKLYELFSEKAMKVTAFLLLFCGSLAFCLQINIDTIACIVSRIVEMFM